MASPSCCISEDSRPSTNETHWSLIPHTQGPLGQAGCGPAPTPTPGGSRPRAPPHGAPQSTGERSKPGGHCYLHCGEPTPTRNRLLQVNLGPTALEAKFQAGPALPSQDKKLIVLSGGEGHRDPLLLHPSPSYSRAADYGPQIGTIGQWLEVHWSGS